MKTTRRRYSAEFKAKVAMEAIRGDLTLGHTRQEQDRDGRQRGDERYDDTRGRLGIEPMHEKHDGKIDAEIADPAPLDIEVAVKHASAAEVEQDMVTRDMTGQIRKPRYGVQEYWKERQRDQQSEDVQNGLTCCEGCGKHQS